MHQRDNMQWISTVNGSDGGNLISAASARCNDGVTRHHGNNNGNNDD
jgi:hypothetical protein